MYGKNTWDDGECTAAPGVMGHKACKYYPGCGCGQSKKPYTPTKEEERENNARLLQFFGADALTHMLPPEEARNIIFGLGLYEDEDEPFPF